MGFFDIIKSGVEYLKEKNEKINEQTEKWENRSEEFLRNKLRCGTLSEKISAKNLLKNNYGYSDEDFKILL